MKKRIGTVLIMVLILLLAGCGKKSLPEGFDEEKVQNDAEMVVVLLSNRDYSSVTEKFAPVMDELDADTLAGNIEGKLDELGDFEAVTSSSLTGGSTEEAGDFATAVLVCKYQNGSATYTISFDREGKICGLYMK